MERMHSSYKENRIHCQRILYHFASSTSRTTSQTFGSNRFTLARAREVHKRTSRANWKPGLDFRLENPELCARTPATDPHVDCRTLDVVHGTAKAYPGIDLGVRDTDARLCSATTTTDCYVGSAALDCIREESDGTQATVTLFGRFVLYEARDSRMQAP